MPYLPETRQYRSFKASNFQPVTRDGEGNEPSYRVRGYFTTFNQEYLLFEGTKFWPAEYEQIDRHALDNADMSDVIMQYDHTGPVMARNKNGSLTIGTDYHGAWCEADLSGCQQARDLYESISNGLVTEMSFAFSIAHDDDSEGYTTFKDEDGDYHTTITRISKVFDCSAVSIPANPGTDISEMRKRSYISHLTEADMERRVRELEDAERRAEEIADAEQPAEKPVEEPEATKQPEEEPTEEPKEPADETADEQLRARQRRMRRARAMRLSSI